ncbi:MULTISPECIES: glycosyltransferase family 9 protein [Acidobacteriaceae]|uniref:glycosyltransferase family 9 protein n=1 Tax=Acidobacteriaceae TaxID=204434 RepID=UPI00131D07C9|nr:MULTISPECIES: glycosyltransferase family 9 protein [Acidobacteriaceae]MDW5267881.1 glycosyltransferase family 9 protein [Edaphobacter sp.]
MSLTSHLGDTILKMPMIEALRKEHPHARIECAVEAGAAPLLQRMSAIDHVYALKLGSAPPITRSLSVQRTLRVVGCYWQQMRQSAPTICVMPRWGDDLFRSNMLGYLTGASRRIGFASDVSAAQQKQLPHRDALLTERIQGGRGMHEAAKFCLLLRNAGLIPKVDTREICASVIVSLKQIAAAIDWPSLADRIGVDATSPFAVIAPGASMPKKVWPIELWAQVMQDLRAKGLQVVVLSGAHDAAIARQLHEHNGGWATLVAGGTSLSESATLISHAKLFLGNDSGPGHVAGALGVPTVILFISEEGYDPDGPWNPRRIHPIGPHVAFCRPSKCVPPCLLCCEAAEAHCIKTIQPFEVLQAATLQMERAEAIHATPTGVQS